MSKQDKVTLQDLDPEAEADALLEADDLERSRNGLSDVKGGAERDVTLEELEMSESLPPPVQTISAVKPKIHPAPIIIIWITLSSSVIIMNAWILSDLDFPYPIFLTTVHLAYATIGTRLLLQFTNLLDGVRNLDMSWDRWLRNIVPIGALFSASLIFSNLAYLTLSISFIQMLKAFTSVAVLSMSVLMGLEQFNRRTAVIVVAISFGVALASYGEMQFALGGFIFQTLGIMFEATRLVAIQKLLQGMRMDPLVSLYYYAPVCAALNSLLIPIFEGWAPFELVLERVGPATLFLNVNVAFLLNVAVVYLIGCASSLVLTLSGVVKDILLVAGSVFFFGSSITGLQMFGYSVALTGLVVFKTPQEQVAVYVAQAKALIGR
ncbi:TPT-domain-containing protein [Meredithblackwellia eburnea MCA 4105]